MTINEELFDALVRHQIGLLQVSAGIRKRILAILDRTEQDIFDRILGRLANMDPDNVGRNLSRAEVLSRIIKTARADAWSKITKELVDSMVAVAKMEPEFTSQAVRAVAQVQLDLIIPAASTLRSIVTEKPFEGRLLREWARDIAREDLKRIDDAIRLGMTQGEGAADIARRVVGSARLRGSDGVTEITRSRATALVRTAVNHYANQARREFVNENSNIFKHEQFVATLDARTTPVCRANDGKTFKTGVGPIPPLHWNCRSTRVPVLDGVALGQRPQRQFTEKQLVKEFADKEGIAARSRDALPRGMKGLYDKFAARRMRELTGTTAASVTYQAWLTRQTASFQNDVLGATRAKLFRKGKLTLDRFVNRQGDEISLHDLAKREKAAFIRAGLDPSAF